MNTPICDFVEAYAATDTLRLHMPGHKGAADVNDITEIDGADSLYEATGIIRESEENASALFGAHTTYSTEGSSQCIRAMLYLACRRAAAEGRQPRVAAGRNAHKTFLSAVALLDIDVCWLYPSREAGYLACPLEAGDLEKVFAHGEQPDAVYVTSPDYLGNILDIAALADVCRRHNVPLLVDNAHGAYLKFLSPSRYPIDLGAAMCCASAHKTLPVLTGGAYLHISHNAPQEWRENAKAAMALFGSTSPSYLVLQSLDRTNRYIYDGYAEKLNNFTAVVDDCKEALCRHGYTLQGDEPLKLTICAKTYGYDGRQLAKLLRQDGIEPEFADPDYLVLMLTPEIGFDGVTRLQQALTAIPPRPPLPHAAPPLRRPQRVMSPRQAVFADSQVIPAANSVGRVLAAATAGCPPAVPIVVSGERIDSQAVACFAYYGIDTCTVVKE